MRNLIITILLIMSLIVNLILVTSNRKIERNYRDSIKTNQKISSVLNFQKIFVDKILNSKGEVKYEDRKEIDRLASNTNNQNLINSWNDFVLAKTEYEAQNKVREILYIIADTSSTK